MQRLTLVLALSASVAEASRIKKATPTPAWACAVKNCNQKDVESEISGAHFDNTVALALRGAAKEGAAGCPFGGGSGGPKASKEEADNFFEGFAKAYDKVHGIKHESTTTAAPPAAAPDAVQEVNAHLLTQLMSEGKEDLLVAFYAPWCPHCKTFVLADPAPIDTLSKELHAANGPKVLSFDTTASNPPAGFEVQYIPTVFVVSKTGAKKVFNGDPADLPTLKAFALAGAQ
jgi:thiol-disulfide isomerase/thioredoxin